MVLINAVRFACGTWCDDGKYEYGANIEKVTVGRKQVTRVGFEPTPPERPDP
jgi:hypothetical protein